MVLDIVNNTLDSTTSLNLSGTNQLFTNIDIIGNTYLLKDTANKYFAQAGTNTPITIRNGGQQIYQDIYSGWQTLAVETVNGDNQVLWKNVSGNFLHIWHLDNNWNWISSEGAWGLNSAEALGKESVFAVDANGDGVIGNPYSLIESAGNTKLVKDTANKFFAQVGTATPTPIKNGGQQIYQDIYSGWQTLAVETVNGDNQVLWKNVSGNFLHIWHLDNNWNWISSEGAWGLNSAEALGKESVFAVDANGDGVIGNPYSLIESAGNTKLVKDTANKFFAQVGTATPTPIKNGGQQIYQDIYSGWQTLAVETVNGDNQVLWKNVSGNFLHIWHLDNNWNWISSEGAWGLNSAEALGKESVFAIDVNGDGVIGIEKPTITISASDANAGETSTGQTANPGQFTFTRIGNIASSLSVNYSVGGTATNGIDYNALNGIATFAANSSTATVNINPIDDAIYEGNETVVLSLVNNVNYVVGTANNATVVIADNTKTSHLGLVTDFNKDGKTDILWKNLSDGNLGAWAMNGTSASWIDLDDGGDKNDGAWYFVGTGDFNNDGNTDIIQRYHWVNSPGYVRIWLMNGNQRIDIKEIEAVSSNDWHIVGTGDFNQDGNVDILLRNYVTGANQVWMMKNYQVIGRVDLEADTNLNQRIVGTGDFNSDGKIDILWRNATTGDNSIWLMNGVNRASTANVDKVGDLNWHIMGAADFNNDGKSDIIWRNYANGQNLVWLMNGSTHTGDLDILDEPNRNFTIVGKSDPVGIWTTDYFGNKDLSGTPTYTEGFTDITGSFSRDWGNGSVPNTPTDNFSARYQTTHYFAPGLYHITTGADDGINVKIGNEYVVNKYNQIGWYSGYFRSTGGYYPVTIEYKEDSGIASINFKLEGHQAFNDNVDTSKYWNGSIYHWDGQGTAPSFDIFRDQGNLIGNANLGSNVRSDGKIGINANWGQDAPNGDNARLPHNFFVMGAWTLQYFDGSEYKFRVRGDDGFHLWANGAWGQGGSYNITPANQWLYAYGDYYEVKFTLPAGWYDVGYDMWEGGGAAFMDISWEKVVVTPPAPSGLMTTSTRLTQLQNGQLNGQYIDVDGYPSENIYQCWDLVAYATGINSSSPYYFTTNWKRGANVMGNGNVAVGTAIATFAGPNNSYDNGSYQHTGIFAGYGTQNGVSGFYLWQQNPGAVNLGFYRNNGTGVGDADNYYVIQS
ncbi:MAG: BPSL0067 family protein [Dolichospermum sp. DET73]|nr:BPSL0067 family protein [Dolichospermum sp. DET73]